MIECIPLFLLVIPSGIDDNDDNDDKATEVQTNFVPSQNFNFVTIFTIYHPSSLFL